MKVSLSILTVDYANVEKSLTLLKKEAEQLFEIAKQNNLVLLEAIKTVYAPCFNKMINVW